MSKIKQTESFQLAKPLADRVLIKSDEGAQTKTAGGIIIPETATATDTKIGTVVSVGEGVYTNDGVLIPMSVKVGDMKMVPTYIKLLYSKHVINKIIMMNVQPPMN